MFVYLQQHTAGSGVHEIEFNHTHECFGGENHFDMYDIWDVYLRVSCPDRSTYCVVWTCRISIKFIMYRAKTFEFWRFEIGHIIWFEIINRLLKHCGDVSYIILIRYNDSMGVTFSLCSRMFSTTFHHENPLPETGNHLKPLLNHLPCSE